MRNLSNDKNYYSKIFAGIPQPKTIVRKIGSQILDENYNILSKNDALRLIQLEKEVICKPTLESGSGRDIRFWKTVDDKNDIKDFLEDNSQQDYIVQALVRQHDGMNKIHQNSLNTIRICSLLWNDTVYILSSCMRMGVGDSRVDNVTAGGISCGISSDGKLDKYAYAYYSGKKFEMHPQGLVFNGYCIPGYAKAVNLVKQAHPLTPHFRLVSWDIAIDENEEAILIEPNMRKGGINLHQFSNGPLFGDLTDEVLNAVFSKYNSSLKISQA